MKINPLEIDLNTVGWDESGGRSQNIWGQVPIENLPIEEINWAISQGRKSCVWTCYDDVIYSKDKNGKLLPCDISTLPKTISATFKPCYERFSAIAENLGMRIAMALEIPTSYNYIVKFDKEKFPQVINHIQNDDSRESVQPYGIVSIDFLKPKKNDYGEITGETLESFADVMRRVELSRSQNNTLVKNWIACADFSRLPNNTLVKNWIKNVDFYVKDSHRDLPKEYLDEQIKRINSRIVRSYILREFLGDCDFTDLNSGIVNLNYAPNHDYGESFNSLIRTKFFEPPTGKNLDLILQYDPIYLERKEEIKNNTLVESLAQRFSQDTSEENLRYITKNFPNETSEVLSGLVGAIKNDTFSSLVDDYATAEDEQEPLISLEEAKMFKIYLNTRAGWLQNLLYNNFNKDNSRNF